jgi:hypothetical protein
MNNYILPERDPNSIINILVKNTMPKPAAAVKSPVKLDKTSTSK